MESKHTKEELKELQALPLRLKIMMTKARIRDWVDEYGEDGVYVSFSGGKDSTVLLDLVRQDYPNVPAVFVDTGLEFPEIREYVRTKKNVIWLRPEKNFRKVIEEYGYPIISKDISQKIFDIRTQARKNGIGIKETNLYRRGFEADSDYCKEYPTFCSAKYAYLFEAPFKISHRCCNIMKKKPAKDYENETGRKPMIATMAYESALRKSNWLRDGCNAYQSKRPISKPMSFWLENDVLKYLYDNDIPIAPVYGKIVKESEVDGQMDLGDYMKFDAGETNFYLTGAKRTGCMFCMFGCSTKDWHNFERMKKTHPKQYNYIMKPWKDGGLGFEEVINWLNSTGNMNIKY